MVVQRRAFSCICTNITATSFEIAIGDAHSLQAAPRNIKVERIARRPMEGGLPMLLALTLRPGCRRRHWRYRCARRTLRSS